MDQIESIWCTETSNQYVCCDEKMILEPSLGKYLCHHCGSIEKYEGSDIAGDRPSTSIRISSVNKDLKKISMSLHADSMKQRQRVITVAFENYYKNYVGYKPKTHVLQKVIDFFIEAQNNVIIRGKVRKGAMAYCYYLVCMNQGVFIKPGEACKVFGITEDAYSKGSKVIDDLRNSGLIKDDYFYKDLGSTPKSDEEQYLARYCSQANLEDEWYPRALQLYYLTTQYINTKNSTISSRCVGIIYFICKVIIKRTYNKGELENMFGTSKSTFTRVCSAIEYQYTYTAPCLFNKFKELYGTNRGKDIYENLKLKNQIYTIIHL